MGKRALILYASRTGNTEKVAQRFRQVLLKPGVDFSSIQEVFVLQSGRGSVRAVESP